MSFGDVAEETFDRMVSIYFKGAFFLAQELSGLLADSGSIVNISPP